MQWPVNCSLRNLMTETALGSFDYSFTKAQNGCTGRAPLHLDSQKSRKCSQMLYVSFLSFEKWFVKCSFLRLNLKVYSL